MSDSIERFFRGTYTAIVTPFKKQTPSATFADPAVDYDAFRRLVQRQIDAKVDGIVPIGTTGESPTLEFAEEEELIKMAVEMCTGTGIRVVPGTGSNWTKTAVHCSQKAEELGADGVLVVSPYYNKPTQTGLFNYFTSVAQNTKLPVMLYNIFGRTNVNVEMGTLVDIVSTAQNIVAVKEASGNMTQIKNVIDYRDLEKRLPESFSVMSGDDGLTLDIIKFGGDGVVSVVSNLDPKGIADYVRAALDGKTSYNTKIQSVPGNDASGAYQVLIQEFTLATELGKRLNPLFTAAFVQTNPIAVKYGLSQMGLIEDSYRSPLCPLDEKIMVVPKGGTVPVEVFPRQVVRDALRITGLLK